MKCVSIATAIAISTISQSLAADLGKPRCGSYKDTYNEPGPVFSWTGFYISGHAGLALGNRQGVVPGFLVTATDYDMNGGTYGLHAGYNHQTGTMLIGVEGDYSWADIQGNSACLNVLNCQRQLNHYRLAPVGLSECFSIY